ncbi:unnamed protein product [Calicophoron daubneyi]|uniref:Carboxylesterase type B domain-containing protein n=1 Tax=Calicophoron daubneyi TaxID=300641 RepID=A0AAV2THM7_CALDB
MLSFTLRKNVLIGNYLNNAQYCVQLLIFFVFHIASCQHWWNFEEQINPHRLPAFTPLPNRRFTHVPEMNKYGPMSNDVIVNIPKAGMGVYIGSSVRVNYDYTWTEWPAERGRLVNMFLGIPYAAPPVGDQRFRRPVPAYLDTRYPWYAKSFRSACMQPSEFLSFLIPNMTDFSEDCLYLNVFSPNRTWDDPNTRYPVAVHIHGGSFVYGSSHLYPSSVLASTGIVIVTLNYRLGPFGFLSTGDFASIGNYGLWDQLLAIRWVKENIEWFRGDPNRITLMGESAGAASVGLHTVSPVSREQDLFHQVIMMSGSDLSPWAVTDPDKIRARYYAIELGRLAGCSAVQGADVRASQEAMRGKSFQPSTEDPPEGEFGNSTVELRINIPYSVRIDAHSLIYCLRYTVSAEDLNRFASKIEALRGGPSFFWNPVVDGTAGFLPRMPLEERKQGRFAKLPMLSGVVHDEGSLMLRKCLSVWYKKIYSIEEFTDLVVRRTIGNILNRQNVLRFNATAKELYTLYTWWPNLANNTARWESMVALVSDSEIVAPLDAVIKFNAAYSNKTYFYEFAYISPNDSLRIPEVGIYHGAEKPFLLGFPFMNLTAWNNLYENKRVPRFSSQPYFYPHDMNMSELVMELWSNFIKYGNPTPEPVKNITWPPYRQPEEAYLFIYTNSSVKFHFRSPHMAFWRGRYLEVAEPVPASPPLYYFPIFDAQLATIVLAFLLALAVGCLVTLTVLVKRRPKPEQFRHDVCLAAPGAAPASAFQTAFSDAFSSRVTYIPQNTGACLQTPWVSEPLMAYGEKENPGSFVKGSHSTLSHMADSPQPRSLPRVHPPPPPIPVGVAPYRKLSSSASGHVTRHQKSPARYRKFQENMKSESGLLHSPYTEEQLEACTTDV